jgi:TonB-dependent receptor
MESIEVSKTISADVDANAPAGTINLRMKRAFDRASRLVSWQANVTAHSEEFNLRESRGPDEDRVSRKIRPGGIFEYSDVFLDRRLGVVLNVSESNVYQEALITALSFNATPTAADPRPLVLTTLNFQHAPRFNKRFATTLTSDYKFSPNFNVGLGVVYNYADLWTPQRTTIFNVGATATSTGRNNVVGTDPLVSFTTASTGSVTSNPVAVSKMGETITLLPRFTYRRGNFDLEGKFAYSDSTSWYDPLGRRNTIRDTNSPIATNITYQAVRSSPMATDWHFTQLAGPDISSGASFSNPSITTNDGRFARSVQYTADLVGTLKTTRFLPIVWKGGYKVREQEQKFEDDQLAKRFDYAPNGTIPTSGAWANYRSPWEYDLGMIDAGIKSKSGGNIFMPNLRAITELYRDRPGDFRQNWGSNADNFYESYVARRRRYNEMINAAFFMGTTSLQKLTARAGLRWEDTSTDASEADPRTTAEMRAAGYTTQINSAGRGITIPALTYQYLSQPRLHRKSDYDNFFPSASLKYRITRNLDAHFGFSSTIRRPAFFHVAGVWLINDNTLTVTSPNPQLKPETSKNYAARLAYYFEPVGQLAVTFTQRAVKNLIAENQRLTAQEFGYQGNDELANYQFVSYDNIASTIKIRSMELEYNQSLSFLGEKFKRLGVRAAYTRLYAEIPRANLTPHLASGGLNYTLGKLNLYANWNWSDDFPINIGNRQYQRHRSNLDAGGGWRITKHYSLAVSARNLTNTPYIQMRYFGNNSAAMVRHEIVGTSWTFAVKGTY